MTPLHFALAVTLVAAASGCSCPDAALTETGTGPQMWPADLEARRVKLAVRGTPTPDVYERLSFVVFENGANDLIFVDLEYGMWDCGEFDLRNFERLIYTGRIPRTLFAGGILINIGDVVSPHVSGLVVTRVAGSFK